MKELVYRARAAGIAFRALVADSGYGPSHGAALVDDLDKDRAPFVVALMPNTEIRQDDGAPLTPAAAAAAMPFTCPSQPGRWHRITRIMRDGHTEGWWAADIGSPSAGTKVTTNPDQPDHRKVLPV